MGTVGRVTKAAPVIIGFDGSAAAERALRDSAALLGPRHALVVTVWEAGRAFETATLPMTGLEVPTALDIRGAIEAELELYEPARRTTQRGVRIAREAGYSDAEGLTVADDRTVADTLIRLARERHGLGIVVGTHGHRSISELLLGSTSSRLVHKADCPVVVVRARNDG
ncbi:universal stress protein [Dactylosporangium vinaceum]